jgi:hypothetical protein
MSNAGIDLDTPDDLLQVEVAQSGSDPGPR